MSKITEAGPAGTAADEPPAGVAGPTSPGLPAQRTAGSQASPIGGVPSEALGVPPPRRPDGTPRDQGWDVVTDRAGVTVDTPAGTVATARVSEQGDEVVIVFWTAWFGLPDELSGQLVRRAFDHPAVRTGRPILVCVPRGDSEVLRQARLHVHEPSAHVAGVTCLIHGLAREPGPAS